LLLCSPFIRQRTSTQYGLVFFLNLSRNYKVYKQALTSSVMHAPGKSQFYTPDGHSQAAYGATEPSDVQDRGQLECGMHTLAEALRSSEDNTSFVSYGKPPARKRLNGVGVLQTIVIPWAIFVSTFGVMSFSMHYNHPEATYFFVVCSFLFPVAFGSRAWRARHGDQQEPSWFLFLAATTLIAWVAGVALGYVNFAGNVDPYLDMSSLAVARNVDPRDSGGKRYADSSRLVFKEGAYVDQDMALGFKDGDTYCVAPVVYSQNKSSQPVPMGSYDFWAVGINCCVAMPPSKFWCGDYVGDPGAHGGLRYMDDSAKFRLALQMAEEEYKIKSIAPIFFTWTKHPIEQVESLYDAGSSFFKTYVLVHLCVQTSFSLGMVFYYSKELTGGKIPTI